jgi:tRNA threonylcarbamoyladenosine biosynthesis protein TsaE
MVFQKKLCAEYISNSPLETKNIGKKLATKLIKNSVIAFFGDLGSGKTTLIKGFIENTIKIEEDEINSPTYVYLNIYNNSEKMICHFDLYRLKNSQQFLNLGFDEYISSNNLCLIEWSERIKDILPKKIVAVTMFHLKENKRKIIVTTP